MPSFLIPPLLAAASAAAPPATPSSERPNIVLFLVDDMGWQDTSVPFWREPTPLNARYRTPNMERLAARGIKFTEAYACPVSSPSRASLITGMAAARHRVTNWTLHYATPTDQPGGRLLLPPWHCNGIRPEDRTTPHDTLLSTPATPLPQLLRNLGYHTILCGKAHFAAVSTAGADPHTLGFDVSIAGSAIGGPGSYLGSRRYGTGTFHVPELEKYEASGTFLTEALTREALAALDEPLATGKPFFLYLSHYAIHVPYDDDRRFSPGYRTPDGDGLYDAQLDAPLSEAEVRRAALIEGMDKSLGDVLDFLDARPDVARRTVILFVSDNGGQSVSPRQGRHDRDPNAPARGGKGSAHLGGVRVPLIAAWPGTVRGGTTSSSRVMIEDLFPTLLDIAGARHVRTLQHVDGRSIVPLMRTPSLCRPRPIVWHFPNHWDGSTDTDEGYGAFSALLDGPYHLLYFWEPRELRLYNVETDIGEQADMAPAHPDLAKRLARQLTDSLRAQGAQRPRDAATGQPVPWPDGSTAP